MAKATRLQLQARIVAVAPPVGVIFALQRGKSGLGISGKSTGSDLSFDFGVLVERGPDGSARFSGEFVQGPAGGKFVYLNSGTLAGQSGSPWTRRAKVGLQLPWSVIERAAATDARVLQARVSGMAKDAGPACASVVLLDGGWTVVSDG